MKQMTIFRLERVKAAEKGKKGNRTRIRPLAEQAGKASSSVAPAASGVQVKKVLVPIDFSESSLKALKYAVAFAAQFGASICLVHVVEPASFLNDLRNVPLAVSDGEVANMLHHKLVMLARKQIDPMTPVHPLVCIGKPFDEIGHRDLCNSMHQRPIDQYAQLTQGRIVAGVKRDPGRSHSLRLDVKGAFHFGEYGRPSDSLPADGQHHSILSQPFMHRANLQSNALVDG